MLGGLDYVKTDIISVPLIRDSKIDGYFLTKLVYTVEPAEIKKLSIPAEALMTDQVYSYLYSNPQIDFTKKETHRSRRLPQGHPRHRQRTGRRRSGAGSADRPGQFPDQGRDPRQRYAPPQVTRPAPTRTGAGETAGTLTCQPNRLRHSDPAAGRFSLTPSR